MKKFTFHLSPFTFHLSPFLALLLFSMLFFGCAKEQPVEVANQLIPSKERDPQRDIKDKVLRFIEKVKESKGNIKNRDNTPPLTIEETVWGVEAVLGIYYSKAGDKFDNLDTYETTMTIPISNGNVEDINVYEVYEDFWNVMDSHLQSVSWPNKKLKYFDLKIDTIMGSQAVVTVVSKVGQEVQSVLGEPPYFGPNVDIQAGSDSYIPTNFISCQTGNAAEMLQNTLNIHYREDNPFLPYYGWVVGWTSIEDVDRVFCPVNDDDENNVRDYLIWKVDSWRPNFYEGFCIPWEDMNWYYDNLVDEINAGLITGKEFIEVSEIYAHGASTGPPNYSVYYHHYRRYKVGVPIVIWGFPTGDWGGGDLDEAIASVENVLFPLM